MTVPWEVGVARKPTNFHAHSWSATFAFPNRPQNSYPCYSVERERISVPISAATKGRSTPESISPLLTNLCLSYFARRPARSLGRYPHLRLAASRQHGSEGPLPLLQTARYAPPSVLPVHWNMVNSLTTASPPHSLRTAPRPARSETASGPRRGRFVLALCRSAPRP